MKISPRRKEGERKHCPDCKENYLQAVYIFVNKKKVKIGNGCPVCLPEILKKKEEE
jgi:hypothetical protein